MSKSSTINVKTDLFKININNERVKTPNYEYSIHHIYLYGFKKAIIIITEDRVTGEIEYTEIPLIDIDNDTVTFKQGEEPVVKHDFTEIIENLVENSVLTGYFEPLYARLTNENNLLLVVNNKYVFNTDEIELLINGSNSIINILVYPIKLIWIYSAKARVEINKSNNKLVFKINENIEEQGEKTRKEKINIKKIV